MELNSGIIGSRFQGFRGFFGSSGALVPWSSSVFFSLFSRLRSCDSWSLSGLFFSLAAASKKLGAGLAKEMYDESYSPNEGACLRPMMRGDV